MGMDLVRQAREAAKANAAPSREKQMAAEHRAALVRYDAEVRQYKGRLTGAKLGTFAGAAGAGGWPGAGAVAAGAGAWVGAIGAGGAPAWEVFTASVMLSVVLVQCQLARLRWRLH